MPCPPDCPLQARFIPRPSTQLPTFSIDVLSFINTAKSQCDLNCSPSLGVVPSEEGRSRLGKEHPVTWILYLGLEKSTQISACLPVLFSFCQETTSLRSTTYSPLFPPWFDDSRRYGVPAHRSRAQTHTGSPLLVSKSSSCNQHET